MLHASNLSFLLLTAVASWKSTVFANIDGLTFEEAPVDCNTPHSLWEQYVCELDNGPDLQKQCRPRYFLSESGKRRSKGLIVAFHGYTACPDSFQSLIETWVPAGYDVMIPLLVGNGRAPGDCADMNSAVYNDTTICVDGHRIDGLPLSRQGYIDFVDRVNAIVKEEKEARKIHKVFTAGLSLGGPTASYAVNSGGGIYDRSIYMNSFFGLCSPASDRDFNTCIEEDLSAENCTVLITGQPLSSINYAGLAPGVSGLGKIPTNYSFGDYAILNSVIRATMTNLVENFNFLDEDTKNTINDATTSWGPGCELQMINGRGGICAMRLRNLLAAHSFSMYAHRLTGSYYSARAPIQFVATERDGSTRNSLNVQAAQNEIRANKEHVSFCTYRIVPDCNLTGNECGVPHAMLSRPEQTLAAPFELYWEDGLQGNSSRYYEKGIRMGTDADTVSMFTARENCVQLNPTTVQDPRLVLPPFRGLWIRTQFNATIGPLSLEQQEDVAELVVAALQLQNGTVVPANLEVTNDDSICSKPGKKSLKGTSGLSLCIGGQIQEFYLEFPSELVMESALADLEVSVMNDELLDNALGAIVLELEVSGRRPRRRNDDNLDQRETRKAKVAHRNQKTVMIATCTADRKCRSNQHA